MEYDEEGDKNFSAWYHLTKDYLPDEGRKILDDSFDLMHFLFDIYHKVMKHLGPKLLELMYDHYPVFRTEKRKLVVNEIKQISSTTGSEVLFNLYRLIQDQNAGVNIREKYPKFDEWVEYYTKPEYPEIVKEEERLYHKEFSDEEWEEYKRKENESYLEFYNWKQKRNFEFTDILQKLIIKYFVELKELNADELLMYGMFLYDEYDYFLNSCENIESFIDYGFPAKDIKIINIDFYQKWKTFSKKKQDYISNLRDRRIAGEMI